jgi:hypothetical protein
MGEEFDMTIQEMGAIGELIGGIAIIISLLYVGLQIRQYSGALRSTTAQAAIQMAEATYAPILSNPDLAEISIRGLKDPAALTEVEMGRFNAQFHNVFFSLQNWFYQWRQGNLDDGIWQGWERIFTDLYTTEGIKYFWAQRRLYFSEEFRDYLEKDLFLREPTPGYTPLSAANTAEIS